MDYMKLVLIFGCFIELCRGNGRLIDPPMRSSLWRLGYDAPPNYNDHTLNCGGYERQHDQNGGKCGVCGDPWDDAQRDNEANGKYANGFITRQYTAGSDVTMTIEMLAPRGGYFELRLCPVTDPTVPVTQECLNQHPLEIVNGDGTRYPVGGEMDEHHGPYDLTVRLPADVTCSQCVIQWKYHAGNEWGYEEDGRMCRGCGPQLEQYNCADVAISAGSSGTVNAWTGSGSVSPRAPSNRPRMSSGVSINREPTDNAATSSNVNTAPDASSPQTNPAATGTSSNRGMDEVSSTNDGTMGAGGANSEFETPSSNVAPTSSIDSSAGTSQGDTLPTSVPAVTSTREDPSVELQLENQLENAQPSPTPYVTVEDPSTVSLDEDMVLIQSPQTQPQPSPTPSLGTAIKSSSSPQVDSSVDTLPTNSPKQNGVDDTRNEVPPTKASIPSSTTLADSAVDDNSNQGPTDNEANTDITSDEEDASRSSVTDTENEDEEEDTSDSASTSRTGFSSRRVVVAAPGGGAGQSGNWVGIMNYLFQMNRQRFFTNQIWGNQGNFGGNTWTGMAPSMGMGFWPTSSWGAVQGGQWGGNSWNQNQNQNTMASRSSWGTSQTQGSSLPSHLPTCQRQQRHVCQGLGNFANDQRTRQYCNQNCPTGGNCPSNVCSCRCAYRQGLQCTYITTGLALPINHQWCNDRCNTGSCPTQYCRCTTVVNW